MDLENYESNQLKQKKVVIKLSEKIMIVWDFTYSASMSIYPSYDKTPQKRFWWIRYNTIYFEILTCRKTQITLTNRTLLTWWHFILLRTSRKIRNHQMTKKKKKYKVNGQMFQISFSHNVKLRGAIFFWTHLK